MKPAEAKALWELNHKPYQLSDEVINALRDLLTTEIDFRQNVRNKELSLDLAAKVEERTGKDQNLQDLKRQLQLARKVYADNVSKYDVMKNYPTLVPRDSQGRIVESSDTMRLEVEDPRLRPIEDDLSRILDAYPLSPTRMSNVDGETVVSILEEDEWVEVGRISKDEDVQHTD